MQYAGHYGHSDLFKDNELPSIYENPIWPELKRIASYFLDTLSLGRNAHLKNKIYEEYKYLLEECTKLESSISTLEKRIDFLSDIISFVDCLSLEISMPDVSGDIESDISLEWDNKKEEELILTFVGDGKIIYSGILSDGTVSGVAYFKDKKIPKNIEALVGLFDSSD